MGTPGRLRTPAYVLCFLAAGWGSVPASAQVRVAPAPVASIATVVTGQIDGRVVDDGGKPLDGVVISALGSTSAFAVSDKAGQFSLRQLPPGPYLVRGHLQGYLSARGTLVDVRAAGHASSSLTLRKEGTAGAPQVVEAGMGESTIEASSADGADRGRGESEFAWRLRHLKRGVLRDATGAADLASEPDKDWFLANSFSFLSRAVETSARAASALFSNLDLGGQVNLLTTGAFDHPADLLQLDRASGVAYFSLGAPVGNGEWAVRAAMNQGDLNSWILAGSYQVRASAPHRYQLGMSYALQRYEGGNAAALAAVPEAARNVGSVFGFDEWTVSRHLSFGYGANFAHYDYLEGPGLFSPRAHATIAPNDRIRIRALVARELAAPGAEEYLPPTRAAWLPPQRTFSPLPHSTFATQATNQYEVSLERLMDGFTVGARVFRQDVGNQMITVFGLRRAGMPPGALGHFYVGSVGSGDITGWAATFSHAFSPHVKGAIDYSIASANWLSGPSQADYQVLSRWMPAALRSPKERVQDLSTSLEAALPLTSTRVLMLYKLSDGFIRSDGRDESRGLDGRFDVQVNQGLPFMNFLSAEWEALVAVRNTFHEGLAAGSVYDELLVIRPPKRIVGGLTVRF